MLLLEVMFFASLLSRRPPPTQSSPAVFLHLSAEQTSNLKTIQSSICQDLSKVQYVRIYLIQVCPLPASHSPEPGSQLAQRALCPPCHQRSHARASPKSRRVCLLSVVYDKTYIIAFGCVAPTTNADLPTESCDADVF